MSELFCSQQMINELKTNSATDDLINSVPNDIGSSDSKLNAGIKLFFGMILDCLTPALCRSFILSVLDKLDELVKQTDNKIDDFVVMGVTSKIRGLLDENNSSNIELDKTLSKEQKQELNFELDNLVNECDLNIQTGNFDISKSSDLFKNISSNINSMNNNPFEKQQTSNPFA